MSCSLEKETSHSKQKRLKTCDDSPPRKNENERPKQCYCFESSECVVRKLRAERLKKFPDVRRKLDFGTDDDCMADRSLSSLVCQFPDDSPKVWNFDFETETPMTGQWDWTKQESLIKKNTEDKEEFQSSSVKSRTLKDVFRVSKNASPKHQFRSPLTPIRSIESSTA